MKAAAMDAEAAKTLDPMTHAHGLVTIGRGGEVSKADSESQPAFSTRFARSRTWLLHAHRINALS